MCKILTKTTFGNERVNVLTDTVVVGEPRY